ncbi:MAG TPA: hypothetical protein VEF33_14980, partial [Syntrophales bacterium]|nr:hypothetical protein [Syntrophales bacterium]
GGPGGPGSTLFDVRETLTDAKGEFYIPSYISFIPFSRDSFADFIIYKPGYMRTCGPSYYFNNGPMTEEFFSAGAIGQEKEIRNGQAHWKGILGIMWLQRAKTYEERRRGMPSPPGDYTSKDLPLLIKIINEEDKNLGLKGGYK